MAPLKHSWTLMMLAQLAKFLLKWSQSVLRQTPPVQRGTQVSEGNVDFGALDFLPYLCHGNTSSSSSLATRSMLEGTKAAHSLLAATTKDAGDSTSSLQACAAAALGLSMTMCSLEPTKACPAPAELARFELVADGKSFKGPVVTKGGRKLGNLRIFVGYDPREDEAYEVCRYSILKHASLPVEVVPIKQAELRARGLYTRKREVTESTEFSFTRFLTPFLAGFHGWAIFVDCDFLYTGDVRELAELADERYALMCVQHDYAPCSSTKMDGVLQTCYPRKNWSSMVLYNCSHPKNQLLTPDIVNSQTGAFLHRFLWLEDKDIGALPFTWNFLVGHNTPPPIGALLPRAIHYTTGGPWFDSYKDCDFADLWLRERDKLWHIQRVQQIDLEARWEEVGNFQRLVFFCLQENIIPACNGTSGLVAKKEEPHVEGEGLTTM